MKTFLNLFILWSFSMLSPLHSDSSFTFLFVKGGETALTPQGLWQGQLTDEDLTIKGREQAKNLAYQIDQLVKEKSIPLPTMAIASPSKRTKQSLDIILEQNLFDIGHTDLSPELHIRKIDPFEKMNEEEVNQLYKKITGDLEKRSSDEIFETQWIEGLETNRDLLDRMHSFMKKTCKVFSEQHRAGIFVTGNDNIRHMYVNAGDIDISQDFKILPGAVLALKATLNKDQLKVEVLSTSGIIDREKWKQEQALLNLGR